MCANPTLLRRWHAVMHSIDVLHTGFYSGRIAEAVVAATQEGGGVLSAGDLGAHRTAFPNPLSTTYRGHKVALLTACQHSSAYAFLNSDSHHPSQLAGVARCGKQVAHATLQQCLQQMLASPLSELLPLMHSEILHR